MITFKLLCLLQINLYIQATIQGFVAKGLSVGEAESLLRRSGELSCEAREIFYNRCNKGSWDFDHAGKASRRPVLVAASVGSYGAYLADGSEYRLYFFFKVKVLVPL